MSKKEQILKAYNVDKLKPKDYGQAKKAKPSGKETKKSKEETKSEVDDKTYEDLIEIQNSVEGKNLQSSKLSYRNSHRRQYKPRF